MDSRMQDASNDVLLKRDHDSVDDFEHLGDDGSPDDRSEQQHQRIITDAPRVDDLLHIGAASFQTPDSVLLSAISGKFDIDGDEGRPVPATPPPSADFEKCEAMAQSSDPFQQPLNAVDPKLASMAFVETERAYPAVHRFDNDDRMNLIGDIGAQVVPLLPTSGDEATGVQADVDIDFLLSDDAKSTKTVQHGKAEDRRNITAPVHSEQEREIVPPTRTTDDFDEDLTRDVRSSVLPVPERSPIMDFLGDDAVPKMEDKVKNIMDDDSWNVVEKMDVKRERMKEQEPWSKPLPALPKQLPELPESTYQSKFETSKDFLVAEVARDKPSPPESEAHVTAKQRDVTRRDTPSARSTGRKKQEIEIAPKEIFRDMGLDAWFNPERLNPKVAALIYWRDPKKSGIVFGVILGVLLSLAYFSLISVLAYLSLLVLSGTVLFRIYKTVLQAIQKTSDGHPFKDVLDLDLALPAEKVHEVADVAVAHANAAVSELRRLFLVEDFVDSVKFGVLLWCLTYVGSWFNGMTLIIIGVVALFTLPKVYETNQEQIDQNLALVQAKINEITAKVKAAIPLGKKAEPIKEE